MCVYVGGGGGGRGGVGCQFLSSETFAEHIPMQPGNKTITHIPVSFPSHLTWEPDYHTPGWWCRCLGMGALDGGQL